MLIRKILILLCFSIMLVVSTEDANAAKKKKPKKPKKPKQEEIDLTQIVKIEIPVEQGKVTKNYTVTCYKNEPGEMKGKKFTPMSKIAREWKDKARDNKKLKKKAQLYSILSKSGKTECVQPEHLSLEAYKGEFTAREAHTLFDRFSFGASPEQIAAAVAAGLEKTVNELLTLKNDSAFDAEELELRCDGYLANDTRNETPDPAKCPPFNRNAVRDTGVRFDLYNRILSSSNGYFYKLWLFLHDERMTAGSNVLDSCGQYALIDHVHMIRRAAFSGDYITFMREWNNDYLGHLVWLDGRSNSGSSPNENYAREFWELGTVGPTGIDGVPVYGDLDIAQSALAFSGWIEDSDDFVDGTGEEYRVCFGAKAPVQHAPGPKTIFNGTPWQATVDTDEDVLKATFAHPRTAEHLAEDIWKEFISPYAREKEIKQLAQLIRDANYNLHPVFRKIMLSRALYAKKTHKSLIKHPLELTFGFLKQTGIPVVDKDYFDQQKNQTFTSSNRFEELENNVIDNLGQTPTSPSTVFGWNEKRLASEQWVLPWRNAIMWIVNQDRNNLYSKAGFYFWGKFFNGLPPAGTAAPAFVDKVANMLNVDLTDAAKAHLVQFLDYDLVKCSESEKKDPAKACDLTGRRLKYRIFDPHPEAELANEVDAKGVIAAVAMSPLYRLK